MILDTILGLVEGGLSLLSSQDYSKSLGEERDKQRVAAGYKRGESAYAELAGQGLPGYESEKADIDSQIPTTLNQAKEFTNSGGLMDLIAKLSSGVSQQKRQLSAQNDAALLENKKNYANYEGNVMGGAETGVMDKQTQLAIAQAYEKMQGRSTELGWVNKGVGGIENDALKMLSTPGANDWIAALFSGKGNQNKLSPGQTDINAILDQRYGSATTPGAKQDTGNFWDNIFSNNKDNWINDLLEKTKPTTPQTADFNI